jgi:hypothetical protein
MHVYNEMDAEHVQILKLESEMPTLSQNHKVITTRTFLDLREFHIAYVL